MGCVKIHIVGNSAVSAKVEGGGAAHGSASALAFTTAGVYASGRRVSAKASLICTVGKYLYVKPTYIFITADNPVGDVDIFSNVRWNIQ